MEVTLCVQTLSQFSNLPLCDVVRLGVHVYMYSSEAVPPDLYRKRPMCMAQYDVFSTCRIPEISVDVSQKTPFTESRHIILVRNGHVRYYIHT